MSGDLHDLPNIAANAFVVPDLAALGVRAEKDPPRILILYGSLRVRSFSRFLSMEAARLLELLVLKSASSIRLDCPCQMTRRQSIQRSRNCVIYHPGRKARCGAAQSGTGR